MDVQIKRVYDPLSVEDGFRVLVDRVWPRGLTKDQVGAGLWLKEAAPSTELRKWFNHDPARWAEFKRRYFAELDANPEVIRQLRALAGQQRLTLLFSARSAEYNQAAALRQYLLARNSIEGGRGKRSKNTDKSDKIG